jgi:hypothetical protein
MPSLSRLATLRNARQQGVLAFFDVRTRRIRFDVNRDAIVTTKYEERLTD